MNAKELILKVINASGDFANIYILLAVNGVPFTDIAEFMSSEFVTAIADLSQRSLFKTTTKHNNIKSALDYVSKGINIKSYFGDYSNLAYESIINLIAEVTKDDSIRQVLGDNDNKKLQAIQSKFDSLNIKDIRRMIQYVIDNKFKYGFSKNKNISEEEIELYGEESNERTTDMSFKVIRYLEENIRRKGIIDKLGSETITTNTSILSDLQEAANEYQKLARLLAINQGIRTMREEIFNGLNDINTFFRDRLEKDFDLFRFIEDKYYRNQAINDYEQVKSSYNILDILASSPHFTKMYEAFATKEKLNNTYSFKYRNYMKCAKALKDNRVIQGNLSTKDGRTIKRFLDEVVMNDFCKGVDFNYLFEEKGLLYDENNNLLTTNGGAISVDTPVNRASFKVVMDRIIIPRLKEHYPNNSFIQDIIMDYNNLNVLRTIIPFFKSPINFNSTEETDQEKYTKYLKDFDSIKDDIESFSGARIEDLFFMYNLIVNNNSFGDRSFTRIFSNSVRNQKPNSIISQFQKYIADLSSKDIIYDIRDLFMRFPDNNKVKVSRNNDGKYVLYEDNLPVDLFYADNTTLLPFTSDTVTHYKEKVTSLEEKLLDLLFNRNASIKLTCD